MKNEGRRGSGFTIVEVAIAAVVLALAAVAAAGYRYHSMMDVRKGEIQTVATKTGLTLLEGWRGDMETAYDPVAKFTSTGITVTKIGTGGPALPSGFTEQGQYRIETDDVVYYATLSSRQIYTIPRRLRTLNLKIGWRLDRGPGNLESTDKIVGLTTFYINTD